MKMRLTLAMSLALVAAAAQADVPQLTGGTKVQFGELPANVQNAVKAQAGSSKIEDVDKGTLNGRTVYEVAFKVNGQHTELRVADDGSVLDRIVDGKSVSSGTAAVTASSPAPTPAKVGGPIPDPGGIADGLAYDAGFAQVLSGATKVSMNQVPENVKAIIRERAGSAKIEDIDKGMMNGRVHYQAAYKKGGKHVELRMTENGHKVREVQEGRTLYWHRATTLDQVPADIRSTIHSRLGNIPLTGGVAGASDNGRLYRFFYNKNGTPTELRITGNGNRVVERTVTGRIIQEAAGAQK